MNRSEFNKKVSETIYQQLGGNRFALMTGAKNFNYSSESETPFLSFKIGRNKSKANIVTIEYNEGHDLYTLKFSRFTMKTGLQELSKTEGVYFDQLQELFTQYTGLYTSL